MFLAVSSINKFICNNSLICFIQNILVNIHQHYCLHKNIFVCLISIHNIIILSRHDKHNFFMKCDKIIILVRAAGCFPKLTWGMFLRALKQKICLHLQYLLLVNVKSNLTIFPTALVKKHLFREVSCNFW